MFEDAFIRGIASGLDKVAKKKDEEKEKPSYGRAAKRGALALGALGAGLGGAAGALNPTPDKPGRFRMKGKIGTPGRHLTYRRGKGPSAGTRALRGLGGAVGGGLGGAAQGALFGLLAHHITKKD